MTEVSQAYSTEAYLAFALDPIHVGAGERQLGSVDDPIIREPGTNLPKIPGTSICGSVKSYMTFYYSDKLLRSAEESEAQNCAEDARLRYCRKPDCPVCVIFGFPEEKGIRFTGMAQFFDVHLLFFPVHTMIGPVWVTSPTCLGELASTGLIVDEEAIDCKLPPDSNQLQTLATGARDKLNLGWLLLRVGEKASPITDKGKQALKKAGVPKLILDKLVLVSDKLYSHVVNSNLEVRTSTAIDPLTGSSKEGALFDYEAIPRSTILWLSVVYKDPRNFKMGDQPISYDLKWVKENVERGFSYYEYLGIGGRTTRGMGRLRILNL